MADNPIVESPDLGAVRTEAGPATAEAINRLYLSVANALNRLRSSVQTSRDRIEPRVFTGTFTTTQNDLDIQAASIVHFKGTGSYDLTGIAAPETSKNRVLFIHNSESGVVTFKHYAAGSYAYNRFITKTSADTTLAQNQSMILVYLNTAWRQIV